MGSLAVISVKSPAILFLSPRFFRVRDTDTLVAEFICRVEAVCV
jgi:hypothetical protein